MGVMRALFTRKAVCSHCGSTKFRPSRRSFGPVSEALGLAAGRCLSCGRRFALRRRLLASAAAVAAVEEAGPLVPPRAEEPKRSPEDVLRMAGLFVLLAVLLLLGILAVSYWEPNPKAKRSPRSELSGELAQRML